MITYHRRRNTMFTLYVNEHILLRILSARDSARLFEITEQSRSYLKKWLPWLNDIQSPEDSFTFIKNCLYTFNMQTGVTLGIFYHEELVGVLGFNKLDYKNKIGSIGYWLAEDYQGKGIMTASVETLIAYGFEKLKLNRVDIHAAEENMSSRHIPERLGFHLEGRLRQVEWLYDHYVDHMVYGLLASEWEQLKP